MIEIREFSGHRMVSDPNGDDRCLGCGWNGLGKIDECRPGTPRCSECRRSPVDVWETFEGETIGYCAPCRNGIRIPRCPWCETPVRNDDRRTEWRGAVWHAGCLVDQQRAGYEVEL